MKATTPSGASPHPTTGAKTYAPPPISWRAVANWENLMPYEAVAKTIFVKANGLPAYELANRQPVPSDA